MDGQVPVSQQIILVYFNPCDDQFMLLRRKFSSQDGSIEYRVNGHMALLFGMNVRDVVPVRVIEKHPNEDAIEHRNCWHDNDLSCYATPQTAN